MNIYIFSEKNFFKLEKITIIKIFFKNKSFQIMNNYIPTIGNIEFLFFYYKNNFCKIKLYNSFFIQKKKELKIICDKYEFL
ncbi:putative F0F1-type ATP synthase epsilon subunit [Candidatus Carsonella ruddii HT isolate Thao2000]|uniref:Putative F0F1-type ATP synthase epsilon subunit n=1 Tax=Candidatus Carsonella ruddii HT isolate Thao2000 TaxID=1202539 RepID=J3TED7_CARRU|nr:hypothetical protein [Candidatus Carsonella ruddii]AFP84057.1 putative F0F1-type ATP synthase epsilon subunit [Candidatus Carsonella ruddii HT isolate Thao2000]